MTARQAQGAEREELWRLVNDNYPGYEVDQRRAGARPIPVIGLAPRWGEPPAGAWVRRGSVVFRAPCD